MPIGPDSPNPMILDALIILWFGSMISGIILDKPFGFFDYFFSALGGIYLAIRIYYTWFYKPKIDPKFKDIWKDGYEEGVKKLQEIMDEEEETQDSASLRRTD